MTSPPRDRVWTTLNVSEVVEDHRRPPTRTVSHPFYVTVKVDSIAQTVRFATREEAETFRQLPPHRLVAHAMGDLED